MNNTNEKYIFEINEAVININGRQGVVTKRMMRMNGQTKTREAWYKVQIGLEREVFGSERSYTSALKYEQEEMQCVICFDETICSKFFQCRHKICSDCYSKLSPRRCYSGCDC